MEPRAECPKCGQNVAVMPNGYLRPHGSLYRYSVVDGVRYTVGSLVCRTHACKSVKAPVG